MVSVFHLSCCQRSDYFLSHSFRTIKCFSVRHGAPYCIPKLSLSPPLQHPHTYTVTNARISPEMTQFVRKLVSTFGIGLEQSGLAMGGGSGPLSHEALAKRAQAAAQDPAFQRLKAQFANDFDFRLDLEVVRVTI